MIKWFHCMVEIARKIKIQGRKFPLGRKVNEPNQIRRQILVDFSPLGMTEGFIYRLESGKKLFVEQIWNIRTLIIPVFNLEGLSLLDSLLLVSTSTTWDLRIVMDRSSSKEQLNTKKSNFCLKFFSGSRSCSFHGLS